MKFLHLADLHFGKKVRNVSMLEEQRHFVKQVLEFTESHRPNAVVIAGDVYDKAEPPMEAIQLFDDFLTELAKQEIAVFLVSGNHDSARLAFAGRLLVDKKLFLCGNIELKIRCITLEDEEGPVHFYLAPFVRPSWLRDCFDDRDMETAGDAMIALLEETPIDTTARNVLVSHQFYSWSDEKPIQSDSERNPVGGTDPIDAKIVEQFDYVALGHLHRAQKIGRKHIRYAGSPIKYSFSEWQHEKTLTLVNLGKKGELRIETFPLTPLRDLREIEGTIETLLDKSFVSQHNNEDYLRIVLTDEEEIIDPLGQLRTVYSNILELAFNNRRTQSEQSEMATEFEATTQLKPLELFDDFFRRANGGDEDKGMNEEERRLIQDILAEISEGGS